MIGSVVETINDRAYKWCLRLY